MGEALKKKAKVTFRKLDLVWILFYRLEEARRAMESAERLLAKIIEEQRSSR